MIIKFELFLYPGIFLCSFKPAELLHSFDFQYMVESLSQQDQKEKTCRSRCHVRALSIFYSLVISMKMNRIILRFTFFDDNISAMKLGNQSNALIALGDFMS